MTPQEDIKQQVSQIKAMLFKNLRMIAEHVKTPENERALTNEQFKKLVWRTEMLSQILKDVEGE